MIASTLFNQRASPVVEKRAEQLPDDFQMGMNETVLSKTELQSLVFSCTKKEGSLVIGAQ